MIILVCMQLLIMPSHTHTHTHTQCLWLRVRVVLVQCLREAVLFTPGSETSGDSKRPTSGTNDTSDKNSDKEGVVLVLSQRIKDFTKCLELLDQHVGMLILRQRKGSLVSMSAVLPSFSSPLPSPPFYLSSHYSFLSPSFFSHLAASPEPPSLPWLHLSL